jgi:hypothetical protein
MKTSVVILAMSYITSIFANNSYDFCDGEFAISEKDDKCGFSFNPCTLYKQIQKEYSNCVILRFYLKAINNMLESICDNNKRCLSFSIDSLYRPLYNREQFKHKHHHTLYALFRNCLYLVNPIYFKEYQDALACNQLDVCYFLIRRTVCPKYGVTKYIECLKKRCEDRFDEKELAIFICDSETFVNIKLEIDACRKICPADCTLDICKIYSLDFWERRDLLKAIFDYHYCHVLSSDNTRDEIIKKIEEIYLNGTERDIKFTSFIIYQLFTDLVACKSSDKNIKRILDLICLYEKKEKCPSGVMVMIEFFVKVCSYQC